MAVPKTAALPLGYTPTCRVLRWYIRLGKGVQYLAERKFTPPKTRLASRLNHATMTGTTSAKALHMSEKPKDTYLDVDEAAEQLARELVGRSLHAALAVTLPSDAFPALSLVAIALLNGMPVSLVSELSEHTRALRQNPSASLLFGTPGKGDPLAHPRITLFARAAFIARHDAAFAPLRQAYLLRQPKAQLYVDFADFSFVRFVPEGALLNGGFGKAYRFNAADIDRTLK